MVIARPTVDLIWLRYMPLHYVFDKMLNRFITVKDALY